MCIYIFSQLRGWQPQLLRSYKNFTSLIETDRRRRSSKKTSGVDSKNKFLFIKIYFWNQGAGLPEARDVHSLSGALYLRHNNGRPFKVSLLSTIYFAEFFSEISLAMFVGTSS
jgi:hypothetical protein